MKKGFRIYDTHTHLGTARHSGRACDAGQMLRYMDGAGIDRSMLIPFPVVENAKSAHDEIGHAVKEHPDRFAGAACLDPYLNANAFADELRRCSELYGFRAWKLQPQYQALNPLSTRHDHVFEAALSCKMTLICHTGTGAPFALPSLWIAPARRFPDLPIVLGHAGGGIYVAESIIAAQVCPNIHIEMSSLMPHHAIEVIAHIPASRLMIGSDVPESLEVEIGKILDLDVAAEVKRQILWETPIRVFGDSQ